MVAEVILSDSRRVPGSAPETVSVQVVHLDLFGGWVLVGAAVVTRDGECRASTRRLVTALGGPQQSQTLGQALSLAEGLLADVVRLPRTRNGLHPVMGSVFTPESGAVLIFQCWHGRYAAVRSSKDDFAEHHQTELDMEWFLHCEQPGTVEELGGMDAVRALVKRGAGT